MEDQENEQKAFVEKLLAEKPMKEWTRKEVEAWFNAQEDLAQFASEFTKYSGKHLLRLQQEQIISELKDFDDGVIVYNAIHACAELKTREQPGCGNDSEKPNLEQLALLECLHKSSRGEVWRCQDQNGRQCVAKMVTKTWLGEIEAAMLTMTANQRHVVKLLNHRASQSIGLAVLVLEYIPGQLYIPSTKEETAAYFLSLIEALHHLHRLGVAHHDLKPNNIMWEGGPNGRGVVLIDFGSARVHPPGTWWVPLDVHFTRPFVAPEVSDLRRCTHNADIWSVGVMMFMMVLGVVPMDDGETVLSASQKSFAEVEEWVNTQISPEERTELLTPNRWLLIQKMLTLDPALRVSAAELYENFESWWNS